MFFGISFILGLIDAIVFLSMDEKDFNRKYNSEEKIYARQQYGPPHKRGSTPNAQRSKQADFQNQYKVNGIKKYKEFDLEGAIEDFKKGLEIYPRDISLHFNLACAYSLTEQVDKAYDHLDKAVSLGFNDFEKIKTHDDLAYVRIQDRFDEFRKNGFRLVVTDDPDVPSLPQTRKEAVVQDDVLLAQLKGLAELRDRGLLSEKEFMIEKKKLTR
jgi:tetratricopeptide (TPR) repeat protein